jgi:hypothetical protein
VSALKAGGFGLTSTDKGSETLFSYRSQVCYHRAPDGAKDQVWVNIFTTPGQLAQGDMFLADSKPGDTIAEGSLWSVTTPTLAEGQAVAHILSGQVAYAR